MMGSLTPPWADELIARNSKVAKKMMSSMSTESYFEPGSGGQDQVQQRNNSPSPGPGRPNRFLSANANNANTDNRRSPSPSHAKSDSFNGKGGRVVDPPSSSPATARMASSQSTNSSTCSSTSSSLPSPSSASASGSGSASSRPRRQQHSKNTEKLSPIRNESFVDEEDEGKKKGFEMTNGGEDLSILEYGPGIVKKLRSRYQSLALRQYSARPTLRRSASLENCLDAVSAEELAATLESKLSNQNGNGHSFEEERNERQHRGRNRFTNGTGSQTDSRNGSPAAPTTGGEQQHMQNNEQSGRNSSAGTGTPRGRTSGMDASARRDRMRRARSVDALHRTKREEEILEKFKHVVLPKEDIVIIEVSKPLPQEGSVANSAGVFNQGENGTAIINGGDKRFPTRLLLTSNNLRGSASILDQQTARNLMISPEHELPPHDIVRETARIFERNQENLNRRIGQALRLSKSQSVTSDVGCSSGPLVPPPASTSPTPSNNMNMNNQPQQQQKGVMAQSTTTTTSSSAGSAAIAMQQPSQDKSFPMKTSPSGAINKGEGNNATAQINNAMANGPSHGQKQIGIIKPTLNNCNGGGGVGSVNGKISNGGGISGSGSAENRVRSPILSPIGFLSGNHKPLIQTQHKPPLSPKPIFTSSPKVSVPLAGLGLGGANKGKSALAKDKESPSTSPILIIDSRDRSLSPFKSESPIPRVGGGGGDQGGHVKSPISAKNSDTPPDSLEEQRRDAFLRSPSPNQVNGKLSPVIGDPTTPTAVNQRVDNQPVRITSPGEKGREFVVLRAVPNSPLHPGQQTSSDHHRQQISKELPPPPPPRTISPIISPPDSSSDPKETSNSNGTASQKQVSQLRVHQKQKNSQGGNGSMVFNFTTRKDPVPDYIEDDRLRRSRSSGGGGDGRMDSMEDGFSSMDKDVVDSKLNVPIVEGGNVIINGRSSIQKRPKSQKLSISFNEDATTTHEYPSESSLLVEEDPSDSENLSPKKPNVISGSSLGSYTPKTGSGSNAYQLGSYSPFDSSPGQISGKKKQDEGENDFIEDYLKPNQESTTWSNEMSSDILF